ncbi:5-formyltetrahydrofolate cyclo-ligase [Eudoraea chungangensis]|uniref:5-formyltetrahydrofolate cyclo-ligase n=1 Tax=Eudoraea chungangensis TaxID=1481905 RepID=UPI0023EC8525|nr:5-formyltetrahydrofolate cyclo-ligase [Eudoraea chungangensis]
MLKEKLRLNHKILRERLSLTEISEKSLEISNLLLDLPIWHFSYFHIFLTIPDQREVDTSFVLSILQGRDKNVIIPKMSKNNDLDHYLLTDSTIIRPNKWNVPEPEDGIEVLPTKIEVVFIPLLAFDKNGNRVGYGKGYYDKFLKECKADVIKIGLSMFEAVDQIQDINDHDIPLNYCITPTRSYRF